MEKCCGEVLRRSVVEKRCEGELWRIVLVKFCGEVLC